LRRLGSNNPRLTPTRTTPISSSQSNQAGLTSGLSTSVEDRPITARSIYPQLIPIYDLGDSASQDILPSPVIPYQQTPAFPPHVQVPPALQQQPPMGPSGGSQSRLSTRLTDEQLATMDRLTREAIDERLKALERVSNTIYGCIDDLMRMRSALPELHQPSVWNAETSARPRAAASPSTRVDEKRPEGSGDSHAEDAETDSS
jgi:E3 ubiquitin-protein ligase synoviolin